MSHRAATAFPIHDLLAERWSGRAFLPEALTPAEQGSLLEAARWAPSSMNEQPWRWIVGPRDQPEAFARILACLAETNRAWCQDAGLLALVVAKQNFDRNGKPNRHAFHDVGLSVGQVLIQAVALGLIAHPMGGYDGAVARDTLGIPEGYEPVVALAVGRPGDPSRLPEKQRAQEAAPRSRRPLPEIAALGHFLSPWK
ncbi:MAG: nitroreductase family protein [Deltaproteobacteria bacterium]|jgi:nitroreductase|nr:nitroreductase family protein [Deltaproteobacteria bacterium]